MSDGDRSQGRTLSRGETGTNLGFPGCPLAARQGTHAQGEGRSRAPGKVTDQGKVAVEANRAVAMEVKTKGLGLECILKLEPGRFASRLDVRVRGA